MKFTIILTLLAITLSGVSCKTTGEVKPGPYGLIPVNLVRDTERTARVMMKGSTDNALLGVIAVEAEGAIEWSKVEKTHFILPYFVDLIKQGRAVIEIRGSEVTFKSKT